MIYFAFSEDPDEDEDDYDAPVAPVKTYGAMVRTIQHADAPEHRLLPPPPPWPVSHSAHETGRYREIFSKWWRIFLLKHLVHWWVAVTRELL
eukprot:361988-Chlamydomonas_euryale.AAC.4